MFLEEKYVHRSESTKSIWRIQFAWSEEVNWTTLQAGYLAQSNIDI